MTVKPLVHVHTDTGTIDFFFDFFLFLFFGFSISNTLLTSPVFIASQKSNMLLTELSSANEKKIAQSCGKLHLTCE